MDWEPQYHVNEAQELRTIFTKPSGQGPTIGARSALDMGQSNLRLFPQAIQECGRSPGGHIRLGPGLPRRNPV